MNESTSTFGWPFTPNVGLTGGVCSTVEFSWEILFERDSVATDHVVGFFAPSEELLFVVAGVIVAATSDLALERLIVLAELFHVLEGLSGGDENDFCSFFFLILW